MICLPVVEDNVEEAKKTAEKILEIADIVEFRVDMLKEVSEEDIERFAEYPSIITIRPKREGRYWRKSNKKRIDLIKKAIECNAKFVDIELREEKIKN